MYSAQNNKPNFYSVSSIPQALILQRAYSYEIVWSEAILNQYILLDRRDYIEDYCNYFDLKDNTIENIVKR